MLATAVLPLPATALPLGEPAGYPASLDSTWGLYLHVHGDNENARDDDDGYADLRSNYDLRGRWARQTLALRFDAMRFFAPPVGRVIRYSGSPDYADEYVLEKLSWSWEERSHLMTAGDSYVTMGRGMALSLRRVDELGVDTSLRGGKLELSSRWLRLQVAGGWTNAGNVDPLNERLRFASCSPTLGGDPSCNPLRIDPADRLAAARVELRWPRVAHLALGEVVLQPWGEDGRTWGHGLSLELPVLPLLDGDLYAEGVLLDRPVAGGGKDHGSYGALNLYLGPLGVLVEGKHYQGFALQSKLSNDRRYSADRTFVYHEPPSLELLSEIKFDNADSRGGRLRLTLPVQATGTLLDAGYGRFVTGPEASSKDIDHFYGGLEQQLPRKIKITARGGARWERPKSTQESTRLLHTDGKLVWPFAGPHSLALGWNLQWWRDPGVLEEHHYEKGELKLGYGWAPRWSFSVLLGMDDEFAGRSNPYQMELERQRQEATYDGDPARAWEEVRTRFAALVVGWTPASWAVLQLQVGSMRGGRKCISNVCRDFPPFSGARLEAMLRY